MLIFSKKVLFALSFIAGAIAAALPEKTDETQEVATDNKDLQTAEGHLGAYGGYGHGYGGSQCLISSIELHKLIYYFIHKKVMAATEDTMGITAITDITATMD